MVDQQLVTAEIDSIDDPLAGGGRLPDDGVGIATLAESIRAVGLLQPPAVWALEGGGFAVVAGRRRIAACKLLGWSNLPVIVVGEGPSELIAGAFAENFHRSGLSPFEEGLLMAKGAEAGLDVDEIAVRVGRRREWVEDRLLMLEWPAELLRALHEERISLGVARAFADVADVDVRGWLLSEAAKNGCTVRVAEQWVVLYGQTAGGPGGRPVGAGGEGVATLGELSQGLSRQVVGRSCAACAREFRADQLAHLPLCVECFVTVGKALRELGPGLEPNAVAGAERNIAAGSSAAVSESPSADDPE